MERFNSYSNCCGIRLSHKYVLLVLMSIFFTGGFAFSQGIQIQGTVKDGSGVPIPSVNVSEKGTTNGVVTDFDGYYEINVQDDSSTLVFSFIGFKDTEIEIQGKSQVDVTMEESSEALSEVVVVGYGTQRRADVTSSVETVKAEDFIKGNISDAAQLIQGKVAGLSISMPSGDPTQEAQLMLRGISSINGSSSPLILVDGVPGSLNTVAPEDIASIDVLKDGSATAIYGTRGTNGVVIITTKDGSTAQRPTIEYNGYVTFSSIRKKMDFLNADDLRAMQADGYPFLGANEEDFGYSTNWLDEITRTAISHVHNINFRAGSESSDVSASLNYRDNEGIFLKTDNNRYTGRIDVNHRMFDNKLKANLQLIASEQSYFTGGDGVSFDPYVYRSALIRNPTEPVKDEDGNWFERDIYFYDNPVAYLEESMGENRYRNLRFSGSLTYTPIRNLDIKAAFTRKGNSNIRGFYQTKKHVSTVKNGVDGYASRGADDYIGNYAELTTNYMHNFKDHKFTFLAGYNYEDNTYEGFYANNRRFPSDAFSYNNLGIGDGLALGEAGMGSSKSKDKLIAFFGRINYNFSDKYLLMASIRYEGSSRFGADNKWGSFPGVSVGWRLNEENFLKNVSWLDNLKLRAGYGVTGINAGESYMSLSSLSYQDYFLSNGKWTRELVPSRNPNPDLRWERKQEFNVGLDFDIFSSRLSGTIDFYNRNTKDALYDYDVPVPPYLYGTMRANAAEIKNSGMEISLRGVPIATEDFRWNTDVSFSTNKNKLVSLSSRDFKSTNDYFYTGYTGEPIQVTTHIVKVGEPIGDFYGLKSVDVNEGGMFMIEKPDGEVIPIDQSTSEDRQVIGNGLPKYYLNWNNSFSYKNWDLNINMRGAFSYQILNFSRMFYENPNINYNTLKSAYDKVYGKTELTDTQRYVSYYIEDGDFWKIDNITLGYSFGEIGSVINNLRLYASGKNLATFTGYKGIDPEVNRIGLFPGNDERDKFPSIMEITFGINLIF